MIFCVRWTNPKASTPNVFTIKGVIHTDKNTDSKNAVTLVPKLMANFMLLPHCLSLSISVRKRMQKKRKAHFAQTEHHALPGQQLFMAARRPAHGRFTMSYVKILPICAVIWCDGCGAAHALAISIGI